MARTMGVEEEMLLVDVRNGRPRSVSGQLLVRAEGQPPPVAGLGVHGAVEGEFQQQQIETHTAPAADLETCAPRCCAGAREAFAAARASGSSVAALGTSPLPVSPIAAKSTRYAWMEDRYQRTAREHLTCGCHVHVSVESDEEGVAASSTASGSGCPSLLALSANSPFWDGEDSGFASYRTQSLVRWPSWGPTDRFGSPAAYHRLVRDMVLTLGHPRRGHGLLRRAALAQHYPTVEIRAADVCFTVEEAIVLAAICRGLVETAAREWAPAPRRPTCRRPMLRLATWQAAREGLEGQLLDPRTGLAEAVLGGRRRARRPRRPGAGVDAGDLDAVQDGLARLREEGNGAIRQRADAASAPASSSTSWPSRCAPCPPTSTIERAHGVRDC